MEVAEGSCTHHTYTMCMLVTAWGLNVLLGPVLAVPLVLHTCACKLLDFGARNLILLTLSIGFLDS